MRTSRPLRRRTGSGDGGAAPRGAVFVFDGASPADSSSVAPTFGTAASLPATSPALQLGAVAAALGATAASTQALPEVDMTVGGAVSDGARIWFQSTALIKGYR